MPHLCSLRI
jgi:Arm DNA-binding domain